MLPPPERQQEAAFIGFVNRGYNGVPRGYIGLTQGYVGLYIGYIA